METDRSLARFAGQFVPLKIVTDGNREWGQWNRKFPVDGNGIPRLYVVRADGKQLYGAVGSLPGNQLPQMMAAALQQSGRSLSQQESDALEQAVSVAKQALGQKRFLAAASALSTINQIGSSSMGSFAKPALDAESLFTELQNELETTGQKAADAMKQGGETQTLITLVETHVAMLMFPASKAKANELIRDVKKNKSLSDQLSQVEQLVKARATAVATEPRINKRAPALYGSILRKFPGSEIEAIAREELTAIEPDSKFLKSMPTTPKSVEQTEQTVFRKWSAKSGKFSTKAKYLQHRDGKVQLQKRDGEKIIVSVSILSAEDQKYLEKQK